MSVPGFSQPSPPTSQERSWIEAAALHGMVTSTCALLPDTCVYRIDFYVIAPAFAVARAHAGAGSTAVPPKTFQHTVLVNFWVGTVKPHAMSAPGCAGVHMAFLLQKSGTAACSLDITPAAQ